MIGGYGNPEDICKRCSRVKLRIEEGWKEKSHTPVIELREDGFVPFINHVLLRVHICRTKPILWSKK